MLPPRLRKEYVVIHRQPTPKIDLEELDDEQSSTPVITSPQPEVFVDVRLDTPAPAGMNQISEVAAKPGLATIDEATVLNEGVEDPRVDIPNPSGMSIVSTPSPPSFEQQMWDFVHAGRFQMNEYRKRFIGS